MKILTFEIEQKPGLRLNLTDIIFILLILLLCSEMYHAHFALNLLLIPVSLGVSFFLFCNVFRIGNHLERFWYIPFTVISGWGIASQQIDTMWLIIAVLLEPLKWLLITIKIRGGHYNGLGHSLIDN